MRITFNISWIVLLVILCVVPQVESAELRCGVGQQYQSIQLAIDDANDYDIVIVEPGAYIENIDFLGKAIIVTSTDPDNPSIVEATIIDGSSPSDPNFASVVTFKTGEGNESVLTGFTITGGTGSWLVISWQNKGLKWNRCGGGVVCYNMSEPTISKNIFQNNMAGEGGGIYIYGNPVNPYPPVNPPLHISPVISENSFFNNEAVKNHGIVPPDDIYENNEHGDGGAIVGFQGCDAIITGNVISGNSAYTISGYGGGIHLRQWSDGIIENNYIDNNSSALGAGIHLTYSSSPTVRGNRIEFNNAGGMGGGGLYLMDSNPVVEYNIISQNCSVSGSGITMVSGSSPIIRNNLFSGNCYGSGIKIKGSSTPLIINNTILGIRNDIPGNNNVAGVECLLSTPTIVNNIICLNDNAYGILATDCLVVIKNNDIWENYWGNYSGLADQTGINGNISIDPNFAFMGYWDPNNTAEERIDDFWVEGNYHLRPGSPCIDVGDTNSVSTEFIVDIDNDDRIIDGNDDQQAVVDMGYDEFSPSPAIDINNDGIIDILDMQLLSGYWLMEDPGILSVINPDGLINLEEFSLLAEWWQEQMPWYVP